MGEPPEEHRDSRRHVVPDRIGVEARERRAIVGSAGGVSVDDLAETVGAADAEAVERNLQHRRDAREDKDQRRRDEQREQRELHVAGRYLLAEIFRGPADHQRADESRDENEQQKTVESRADAAWRNAAEQKVEQRSQT